MKSGMGCSYLQNSSLLTQPELHDSQSGFLNKIIIQFPPKIDKALRWLSSKITTCWNSPLKLYKHNREENLCPKSPYILILCLSLSFLKVVFFSSFLPSLLLPPFSTDIRDTWNLQIPVELHLVQCTCLLILSLLKEMGIFYSIVKLDLRDFSYLAMESAIWSRRK